MSDDELALNEFGESEEVTLALMGLGAQDIFLREHRTSF